MVILRISDSQILFQDVLEEPRPWVNSTPPPHRITHKGSPNRFMP